MIEGQPQLDFEATPNPEEFANDVAPVESEEPSFIDTTGVHDPGLTSHQRSSDHLTPAQIEVLREKTPAEVQQAVQANARAAKESLQELRRAGRTPHI